jgi:hypothetical protein
MKPSELATLLEKTLTESCTGGPGYDVVKLVSKLKTLINVLKVLEKQE